MSTEPELPLSPDAPDVSPPDSGESEDRTRLHKVLAHRGVTSRRKSEQLIASGLVTVNGIVVTEPGSRVDPDNDHIEVEGRSIAREAEPFLFLFYKPKGVVSTMHDPEGRPTIRDYFPNIDPLLHIGRLDYQTEGVLLLTNNGDLSQRILHPRFAIPRTYLVKIQGGISVSHLERIAAGDIKLDGRPVEPLEFVPERNTETNAWYRITLTEGRNREVRRIFETLNYFVMKLVRTAFGPLTLSGLDPGEYRTVTASEKADLLRGATPAHPSRTLDSRYASGESRIKTRGKKPTGSPASGTGPERSDRFDGPAREGSSRPPSGDRPDRSARPDRPYRSEGRGRPEFSRPERSERPFREGSSRPPSGDRPDRAGRPDRPYRSDGPGAPREGRGRPEFSRPDRFDRPAREGSSRPPFGDRPDRAGRERPSVSARPDRTERPKRPENAEGGRNVSPREAPSRDRPGTLRNDPSPFGNQTSGSNRFSKDRKRSSGPASPVGRNPSGKGPRPSGKSSRGR